MTHIVADLSFLALTATSWALLYRVYLPYILAQEKRLNGGSRHHGGGLTGGRYVAWTVGSGISLLPLFAAYHVLRRNHPPTVVTAAVMLLSYGCILSGHRLHGKREAEDIPEVRFGAVVGGSVAFVVYFVFADTVLK
jgi:hypothetical protein